jgi:hypothetical protein
LVNDGTTLLYLARKHDCDGCELKSLCCPKAPFRRIPRDIHEHARDVARSFADTDAFEQSRRERKKIEMRFAHLKRILKLGRLRLRGPEALRMSLFWPPSLRISGGSLRWSRDHHPLRLCVPRSVGVA